MSLGDQLRKYRLANGFTQLEIAKTLGIDRSSYSNYESDATNPSIENLCALAKIFGTTPDVLTGFCSGKNEPSDSVAYSHRVYNGCDELRLGFITPAEKHILMLYRLCDDKDEAERLLAQQAKKKTEE